MVNDKNIKLDDGFEEVTDVSLDEGFEEIDVTTVKKKDDTTNGKTGSSTSVNTNSQSQSPKQSNLTGLKLPAFLTKEIPGVSNKTNTENKPISLNRNAKPTPKDVLGKGTVVPTTVANTTKNEYQVDITDKSKDATKTQVEQTAQIQNDVDTGVLEQRNKSTYQGASKDYKDKATEIAGGDLIEYSKVLGVDDDMLSRVDDNDKQIYQTNEQLKNLYANLDIYNTRGDVNNAKQIQKSIDEAEKVNAELMLKRNSQLDSDILQMQKQFNNGITYTKIPQYNVQGVYTHDEYEEKPMSDNEKTAIKSQIESLKKRKGVFLQDTENPQEVFQALQPKIIMYEKQNIIPKDASSLDKMRIYYGIKLTQLKELKKQSESENSSVLIQQNPILKALGIDTEKIGTQVVNSIKQRFVDDKTTKSIQEIEGELNAIAPILANNLSPNTKKSGFWKTAKNEFVDALSATTTNNTSQDNAQFIQKATQEAGVNLTEDKQKELALQQKGKDYAQNNERFGQMIGNTAEFALEFGVTSALGGKLLNYGAKLLKLALPTKAYAGVNIANNALRETKLGNLVLGATDEAIKYEIAGTLNRQLKDDATASQGATGFLGSELGEKFAKPIASLFGANGSKFISLLGDTFGRTVVELFEETGQNTAQLVNQVSGDDNFITGVYDLFKDSEKGKEFISQLKENYSDADENVQFVASIFAMSFAFNTGKFGKFFTDLAFKKKEELSETDKEKVDVIIDDLSNEYTQAQQKAVEETAKAQGKTEEEVLKDIEQATAVNIQSQEFGDETKQNTIIDETKTESTESIDTGKEQNNITGVQETPTNDTGLGTVDEQTVKSEEEVRPQEIQQKVDEIQVKLDNNQQLNGEEIVIAEQNKLKPNPQVEQKQAEVTKKANPRIAELPKKKAVVVKKTEEKVVPIEEPQKKVEQNSQNIIKFVEDNAENELANSKLTEQDNVEQEPGIKDIEGKAESNDEAKLNEVVNKADELVNGALGISRIPLSELSTDESRFQARDKLNEQVVNDIAENFSDADQDPIHVWTDPKDGKTYVLSGHHRYYGAKKAGRTDVKIIDRTNDFTEKEAIKFATEDANANRSMETPLERANTLRKKREKGDSKEEINSFLEKEGKNKGYVENLSYLNPKGKTIETLNSVEDSGNKVIQKETEKIADWIGDARKSINGLTDAHENEMFDFLMDKDTSKRITTKADFLQKVRSVVNPLLSDEPLNLQRFKNKTQGEQSYDEDVLEKKAEITERQKQIDAINDRFSNPANPDYINTTSADYAQARKIADDKISKLDTERKALQKQLEDIYRSKGKYTSANTTGDLFGQELIADALDRIADKIGSKKNLTEQEKTSLIKDVTDLAKGLIQEGKATLDNVIDKIKEAIKKRFPDLDEKDINDISENIKQKVVFDEAFQWYKDNDYTYEEAKKELDDNDVDYNEKDLKDVFDGKKEKAGKEKRLQNRAFDGTTDEELKSIIEDYGLTYETQSRIIATKEANDIITEVGLDKAFQAVQNGYIKGAQAAVIYGKMVDDVESKLQDGDLSAEQQTKLKEIQAYLVDLFDTEARESGRFIDMLKQVYHKSLFTYDTMVKSATKAKGEPLTEEERLQIKEQSEKIAEFDKKIKELEAELEVERANNAVKNIKTRNNKPKSAAFRVRGKALADKVRKLKTKGLVLKDADGNPINLTQNSIVSYNDIIEMVAKAIEKTGEIIDGIETALNEIKKQDWYQNLAQRDKDAVDKQLKQDILDLDDDVSDDKFKIPHSLIREIVKNGTEDIDGIVKKVLEVYQDVFPDLDERKVRDIITKYGEQVSDLRDDIDKKISHAKRIGKLLSGKDDLLEGKLPKRSGYKRDKPSPDERLLMQEIQQLLKNIPKSQEELDTLWATALDKVRNRVKNRIEELQLAIDKKEKINKQKNVQNYNDTELDNLKSQLKDKQKEYDEKFPKEKTSLSDEQRLNQIINSKKKRLEALKEQKINKVFERTKKEGVDKSKFPELAKDIADIEAEIKVVTDEIRQDETWVKHVEKKRIELAKKSNQRRIEELQRRIREKDFTTKKNPTPVDDELKKIRKEKQKVADDYEHAKHKFELENRTTGEKVFDGVIEALSLSKQLVATADLSAPLRQGATVMFSNPMIFGKAFMDMHKQAFSHDFYEESIDNIKSSDTYDLAQDSGLDITDVDSINERKRDEQYVSRLMDSDFAKKMPILRQYRTINKGSERAYSGFLNNIRFNLFEKGVRELEQAGYKFEDNPVMFKALATTINNLTGRGISPTGKTGKILNFVMFSPKMLTSRFLLLYDLVRKDIPLNAVSRKMAAKSLLGTVAWISMFNLLGTVAKNALDDEDDEDLLKGLNKKAVATDFAKVRDKQTTFDPTAGYAPLVRTLARFLTEKSINSNGVEKDLANGYGTSRFSPIMEFLRNKMSPIASYATNLATHRNPANSFEKSDKAKWYDYITPLTVPLQAMQVAENFNDKDKFAKDLLEVTSGLYGIGVQQYDNTKADKKTKSKNNRGNTRGKKESRSKRQ